MINKYILPLIVSLVLTAFLLGCGKQEFNTFESPRPVEIWDGFWASNKVTASGTISLTVNQSGTAFSGSITMTGSPCFSTSTIAGWTVAGDTVSWSSPGIGNFTGTISGASIVGTYSVTSSGACFGDTGIFSVTIPS